MLDMKLVVVTPSAMREVFGWRAACKQLGFMCHELQGIASGKPVRWLVMFFGSPAGVIISYRVDRFFYLIFGRAWFGLRILFFPLFSFLRLISCQHEISCKAQIGPGLRLIHPTLSFVVHGDAIVGKNCVLSGGNSIGVRRQISRGELILGDDVHLGLHACILGPVRVGSHVMIGAGAVVVKDLPDHSTAVGVPAKVISRVN